MSGFNDDVKHSHPQYLDDEGGLVKEGKADRIYFPINTRQVQKIVQESHRTKITITISGGGTGLSGGRVPYEGWIIATDKLRFIFKQDSELWVDPETNQEYQVKLDEISEQEAYLTVPVSMTLKSIQNHVREKNWFYPPDPTERTSFIGGNVVTNASGARSFKYGATRDWIQGLCIVLPEGRIFNLNRDYENGIINDNFIILRESDYEISITRPKYQLPEVTKDVAAPIIKEEMHPLDLFIGSGGIFGVVTEVTLKLIRPPKEITSIFVFCNSYDMAFDLIQFCQRQRLEKKFPIPLSVEFLDDRAVDIMRKKDDRIQDGINAIVMLEQDTHSDEEFEKSIKFWNTKFIEFGIEDTYVALTHNEIEHHKFLRHCVPEYIIALTKKYGQSLMVTDYSVPEDKFKKFFFYMFDRGNEFENFQISRSGLENEPGFSFFGHAGDCHIHLALIPRSEEESTFAQSLFIKIMIDVVKWGGSIAAEHGLGKKTFNDKPALHLQYGMEGINQIKRMKETIDPDLLLNPVNLIGP